MRRLTWCDVSTPRGLGPLEVGCKPPAGRCGGRALPADMTGGASGAAKHRGRASPSPAPLLAPALPPLAAYIRLWSVSVVCRVLTRAGAELVWNEAVAAGAVAALCFPLQPAALILGFGLRITALLASLPYIHDSQHWCLHTDLAVCVAVLGVLRQRAAAGKPAGLLAGLGRGEAAAVAAGAAATVRAQYIVLYAAAALFVPQSTWPAPTLPFPLAAR